MWILLLPAALAADGTGIDVIENYFGATNIGAVLGHGGLTAGISAEGDLTVLSWPGPSQADQLAYVSSNALDARSQPRMGAPEGAGMVLGLWLETAAGGQLTWLRDGSWEVVQEYDSLDDAELVTTYLHEELGLSVTVRDVVHPDQDSLVRRVTAALAPSEELTGAWLLTYANLSPVPSNSFVPELPFVDWALDGRNDFAAAWDAQAGAAIHLHPEDQRIHDDILDFLGDPSTDWGPLGELAQAASVDSGELAAVVADLDQAYAPGAWLALTTDPAPDQHQVGLDRTDWCGQADLLIDNLLALPDTFPGLELPIDSALLEQLRCGDTTHVAEAAGLLWLPQDPWTDASDGELSGSGLALGETATILRTPLAFAYEAPLSDLQAHVTVVVGAGPDHASAVANLDVDSSRAAAASQAALDAWLDEENLPELGTGAAVTKRSLANLRVGTDAATGALVASPARQPSYALDWPRDGAFFNLLLDATGHSELVEQRVDLYASWQRREPAEPDPLLDPEPPVDPRTGSSATYPAHAWEMNYTADGQPGGNIRFEIDTTAFAVWTTLAHVGWAEDPDAWLRQHWDTVEPAVDLLAEWRDAETGLHAPAQEDDSIAYTQTLHGAITVFGTLDLAARCARFLGEEDAADRWVARGAELQQAILTELWDEEEQRFIQDASGRAPFEASGRIPTGPSAWLVWPMTLLPYDDPRVQAQLAFDLDVVEATVRLEDAGGAYWLKNLLAAAVAGYEPERVDELLALTRDQATPTGHFGEVMVNVDGVAEQRVATPHLWEGALFALTAIALEDPSVLTAWDRVLPPSELVVADDGPGAELKGCTGCAGSRAGAWLILPLWGLRRRRTA